MFLPLKALDLEDDVGVNVSLVIEHGIGEGLLGHSADFSGDAERNLVDGLKSVLIQDGLLCPGQFEVMSDIKFTLLGTERGHVVSDGDSLVDGLHNGKLHNPSKV